jgi:hypothetical protein
MTQTTVADFVSMLSSAGHTNDYYLVANNYALQTERLAPLFDDIGGICGLLDSASQRDRTFLWLGRAGTVTPLHHDKTNLLIAQVLGRKRIILYPTASIRHMNNIIGVFTAAAPENPERSRHSAFCRDPSSCRRTLRSHRMVAPCPGAGSQHHREHGKPHLPQQLHLG